MTTTLQAIRHVQQAVHYYAMLDTHASASHVELQAARRGLALVLHPDRTTKPGAAAAMAAVNVAYDVLSDSTRAKRYRSGLGTLPCPTCGGAGCKKRQVGFHKVIKLVCSRCAGSGVLKREKS